MKRNSFLFSRNATGICNETDRLFGFAWHWKEQISRSCGKSSSGSGIRKGLAGSNLDKVELIPLQKKTARLRRLSIIDGIGRTPVYVGTIGILDSVAASANHSKAWRQLAEQYHANCRVIECICSDEVASSLAVEGT